MFAKFKNLIRKHSLYNLASLNQIFVNFKKLKK